MEGYWRQNQSRCHIGGGKVVLPLADSQEETKAALEEILAIFQIVQKQEQER